MTQVVESFSSDLLQAIISYLAESHLEYCQTSTMELFCKRALACSLFLQKSSTADVWLDFKCAFDWMCCKCEVSVDCKCMEFVAACCCTGKKLRSDQTTSLLEVIRLEVTRLKKTRFVYLLDLLGGRGRRGSVIYCVWSTFRWLWFCWCLFHVWYGFSSLGSWSYSGEWYGIYRQNCYIASGKWNVSRVTLQEFYVRELIF